MESRMNRRNFLSKGLSAAGTMMIAGCQGFGAAEIATDLPPENVLSADIACCNSCDVPPIRQRVRRLIQMRDRFPPAAQ